jgi:hypothetical protein
MSLNDYCRKSLATPFSEHYGWTGSLVFFQAACLFLYIFAVFIHRKRIFVREARKWDLDHVFITLSTAAAAAGVVTWTSFSETNAFYILAQTARDSNSTQRVARELGSVWTCNAVYLIFKPISIGLYAYPFKSRSKSATCSAPSRACFVDRCCRYSGGQVRLTEYEYDSLHFAVWFRALCLRV